MFRTVFRYSLLRTVRVKSVLFWSLAFPIILGTLFHMAFGNIYSSERLQEPIRVAFVAAEVKNPFFDLKQILGGIENDEGKLFELVEADEAEATRMVQEDAVAAAVLAGEVPALHIKRMGAKQVVVKQVLDQVAATRGTITSLMKENPLTNMTKAAQLLSEKQYTQGVSPAGDRMKPDIIYFMALLAMGCLGACGSGAAMVMSQQANRSAEGARASASPANKWARVWAAGLAGYLVQFVLILVVLAYVSLGLGRTFGDNLGFVLAVLALGTAMGYLMGMAIACLVRGSENTVMGIASAAYLFSSFLTGLMSEAVKRLVDTKLPLVSRINPGSMIVDALYTTYYFQQADYKYLAYMALTCLVFAAIITLTLRRRYHDSI